MATVAELVAVLRADTRGFTASMLGAQKSVTGLSTSSKLGAAKFAAMGIAAVGVAKFVQASVTAFIDFEATMVRTVTLAGSSEASMHRLSAEVLALAGNVGRGPQELAEALYFVQSSGISAANAMEVVEVSAKAAALGLGETQTVADAITSVLNAYGEENISAAQATDTLVAAVREGKGEADAIAGAIGRVIPVASEMGVEFEEVAAGIAALTRTGLDANEAVTALRGIMVGLLDPTDRAVEVLKEYGLSVSGIQRSIADEGLLETLTMMRDKFEGNDRAMAAVFGNVRALTGALSLLGTNAAEAQAVFDAVRNSAGSLDKGFSRLEQTTGFKLKQAFAEIQSAMIEVGGAFAPFVAEVAQLAAKVAPLLTLVPALLKAFLTFKAMTFLPMLLRGVALGIAAVSAATKTAALGKFAAALSGVASKVGIVAAVTVPLIDNFKNAMRSSEDLATSIGVTDTTLQQIQDTLGYSNAGEFFMSMTDPIAQMNTKVEEASAAWTQFRSEMLAAGVSGETLSRVFAANIDSLGTTRAGIDDWISGMQAAIQHEQSLIANNAALAANHSIASTAVEKLAAAHNITAEAAKAQMEAERQLAGGLLGLVTTHQAMAEAQSEVNRLQRQGKTNTQAYRDATLAALQANLAMKDGLREYFVQIQKSGRGTDFAVGKVMALGREMGISRKDVMAILGPLMEADSRFKGAGNSAEQTGNKASTAGGKVRGLTGDLNKVPNDVNTMIRADTTQARTAVSAFASMVSGMTLIVDIVSNIIKHSGGIVFHQGGEVPKMHGGGLRADERPAILQAGEFVMQRRAVKRIGAGNLAKMNAGQSIGGDGGPGALDLRVTIRPDRRRMGRDLDFDSLVRGG